MCFVQKANYASQVFSRYCLCLEVPSGAPGKTDTLYIVVPLCRAQQLSGDISPLQLLEENQSLVSHPPLVCGHLEAVYLEKNNNLFYSCWGWKTFCLPLRRELIGISGREVAAFYGGRRMFICVCRCWSMLGVSPAPRSTVLLRSNLLLKSFFLERAGKVSCCFKPVLAL